MPEALSNCITVPISKGQKDPTKSHNYHPVALNAGSQYVCCSALRHNSKRQPATINGFVNYCRSVFHVAPYRVANVAGIDLSSIPATVQ